jgi:hypothetical protein
LTAEERLACIKGMILGDGKGVGPLFRKYYFDKTETIPYR